MYQKEKALMGDFIAGKLTRRELISRLIKCGLSMATAGHLLNLMAQKKTASDFNWKKYRGQTIRLLLNKHPYTDAMIANLSNFKKLTGMKIKYDVFPEDVYFDKVTASLSSKSKTYDAFMTGAYMTWTYGPAGWIEDLNRWIKDPRKTSPSYKWDDVLSGVRKSCAWNGRPGDPLGSTDAKQWCVPWGYEQNNLSYNKSMFNRAGVSVPTDMDELTECAAKLNRNLKGVYGIGVRGSRSWATIHPGFLSAYTNYGQKDLNLSKNGKLSAAMNTSTSKEFHAKWVKMIQESGPKNWSTYTWYQVGADLGAGASAMIYDADILGYFMNGSGNKMAGQLNYAPFAAHPSKENPTPNIWIWALAMSRFSARKDAAWYFIQWATGFEHTLFGAQKKDLVNPVRKSVWKDPIFIERLNKSYPGYVDMHDISAPGAKIHFTAQPLFFDLTTEWASSLQKMVANQIPVDEGLDQLAESVNRQLKESGLG